MKKPTIISILIIALSIVILPAQDRRDEILKKKPTVQKKWRESNIVLPTPEKGITFLEEKPVIDGVLDKNLSSLHARNFDDYRKSEETNSETRANYRMAYGIDFLYLYIESKQKTIDSRDRGYQNGDGFHMVIAQPQADTSATDRFYVLSFTPRTNPGQEWQKKFVWYRDVDVSFNQLENTEFKAVCSDGKAGYEVLIPWTELYPYHPGINKIGFNLCFVRALPELQTNYHYVVYDEKIQNEQSKRKYLTLDFAKPSGSRIGKLYSLPPKNIFEGESFVADIYHLGLSETLKFKFKDFVGQELLTVDLSVSQSKPEVARLKQNVSDFPPGDYTLEIERTDVPVHKFSILPKMDFKERAGKLLEIRDSISSSSLATLQFNLLQIEEKLAGLYKYDDASQLNLKMKTLNRAIRNGISGKDFLAEHKTAGDSRRAYRSKFDNTLQPYSLALPPDYDSEKKYPMLIWLHGSGVDDRNSPINLFAQAGMIGLAPNGRGTTTAYCRDNSQVDIKEVIEEVCAEFSVDKENIILCGFSMGGYGVYRSYFEAPERYKALAIFSGHPNLSYGDIDFLEDKNVEVFKDVEMFLFHGDLDRNCPIERTLSMVEKLKSAGAKVEFHMEKGVGHSQPGPITQMAFQMWIGKILLAK